MYLFLADSRINVLIFGLRYIHIFGFNFDTLMIGNK